MEVVDNNSFENKKEKLIDRLKLVLKIKKEDFSSENVEEIYILIEEFNESINRESAAEFCALISAIDPFPDSPVEKKQKDELYVEVFTESWEKAVLLGLVPEKKYEIPLFIMNEYGERADEKNPF